jgi:ankyrin repeat protein
LEKAVVARDAAGVQRLLASGADPNEQSAIGPPLSVAAAMPGNKEVIRMLLQAGADLKGRRGGGIRCGIPPVWQAAFSGDVENTRVLLDAGASLAQESGCLNHSSPGWLHAPVIQLLQQYGLDIHAVDAQGRNALHLALAPPSTARAEAIEYLIQAGVSLTARDHNGETPMTYWRKPRNYEKHWLQTWLLDRLSGGSAFRMERENRARVSAVLERTGIRM